MDQWEREWVDSSWENEKKVEERPKSNVCRSSKKWQVNDKDNREYEFSKY